MDRSPIAPTGSSQRLLRLALSWRALYLRSPGLMTKILAIIAFFSIGFV